ncbi:acyltransferase family protein [Trinickia sp.]|uniref:acyltransferase family protein n=1 Tax=Trinickia sp. TaxID=2571163 RepID=UPI003F810F1E
MQGGKQTFEGIQALRAIAALAVVLFHTLSTFDQSRSNLPHWINAAIQKGDVGVDLFFVISGFVITLSAMPGFGRDGESSLAFLIKRFFRIAPAYWAVSIVYIYYFPHIDSHQIAKSLAFYPLRGDQAPYYGVPVLYVGWSLVYEVYFYLVFGASLTFGRRAIFSVLLYFVATLIIAPVLAGNTLSFSTGEASYYRHAYFSMATNPIITEFLYGVGVAYLYRAMRERFNRKWLRVFLSASVGLTLACLAVSHSGFDIVRHGLPFSALVLAVALAEHGGLIRMPRFAVYLGEISYGIYLVHPVALLFLARTRPLSNGPAHIEAIEYMLVVVMTIFLASKLHRYLELPCIDLGRKLVGRFAANERRVTVASALKAAIDE